MSLARGRFGVEYDPRRRRNEESGGGWILVAVLVMAVVSFVTRIAGRHAAPAENTLAPEQAASAPAAPEPAPAPVAETPAPTPSAARSIETSRTSAAEDRPPRVRNLLLRLEEAERQGNVEMAATTLESLRSLPGELAADLDDTFAERLGELNIERLFTLKNRQWIAEVVVRPGESGSRIARAYGSTLASLVRLNGLANADRVLTGQKLLVMDHPRFILVIHKLAGYADLNLNGKFFRRYSLAGAADAKSGAYKLEGRPRAFFAAQGVSFPSDALLELETLLPPAATMLVSEK